MLIHASDVQGVIRDSGASIYFADPDMINLGVFSLWNGPLKRVVDGIDGQKSGIGRWWHGNILGTTSLETINSLPYKAMS